MQQACELLSLIKILLCYTLRNIMLIKISNKVIPTKDQDLKPNIIEWIYNYY